MIYLLFLIQMQALAQPPLLRVNYDLELIDGTDLYSAKLVLNKLDDQRFSLLCRKPPGRSIFIYWSTIQGNLLLFPSDGVAFKGDAGESFRLFPKGPELSRDQWLALLENVESGAREGLDIHQIEGWSYLVYGDYTIRWRERSRDRKRQYKDHVLQPSLKEGIEVRPLNALLTDWAEK